MKRLNVAEARARIGEILDDAERGVPVCIERRGVRFQLVAEPARPAKAPKEAIFEFVDDEIADGQWTWKPGAKGLRFAPGSRR